MGGNPDLLPFDQAIRVAAMPLAGSRYFVAIHDFSVRHLHPPQHLISAFDKNPALYRRHISWRISYLAAEGSINGKSGGA